MKNNRKILKIIKKIGILCLITLMLECLLFNYRYWESLKFFSVKNITMEYESGIEQFETNQYRIIDSENAYVKLSGFQTHIDNIYLDIKSDQNICTYVELYANDSANQTGIKLGDTTIVSTVPQSYYTRLHLSGVSTYIRIKINHPNGFEFYMNTPSLNIIYPFIISVIRLLIIFTCLLLLFIFRPGSPIYCVNMRLDSFPKKIVLVYFIMLHLIFISIIGHLMPNKILEDSLENWPAGEQYNELADAFMKGNVYLDRTPPRSLESMENPYDPGLRNQIVIHNNGETFDWDYAYFNGKYYSYFGPVPVILFFIPFRIIFGRTCSTWSVVRFCTILFCLAGFRLIYVIGKRYYKSLNYGIYLLMSSFYIWGSAIVYLVYYGIVYSLPIICGLLLGTIGLTFWILAKKENILIKKYLFLGSICVALIMGCRVQMFIVVFLAFPIFWQEILDKKFFSKKGMVNTLCMITPFLIIGILIMYYNYIRFDSPFDFGANYNLTGNDMTHRGWVMDRFPLAIFIYLFQPINMTAKYPFMQAVSIANDYMGKTSSEPLFGGFFSINLISIISIFVFQFKKILKENKVYGIAISCFVFAIIIMLADTQLSGLTQRYMSDFGWLISLCVVFQIFSLDGIIKKNTYHYQELILILMVLCIFLNLWNILITGRYGSLISTNPTIFYTIKYWIPFI